MKVIVNGVKPQLNEVRTTAGVRLANADAHERPLINFHELAEIISRVESRDGISRGRHSGEISFRAFVI